MNDQKQYVFLLPDNVGSSDVAELTFLTVPLLEMVAFSKARNQYYMLESHSGSFSYMHSKQLFADPGTIFFKKINPLFVFLPTLMKTQDKFVAYDQIEEPCNNLDLLNKIHESTGVLDKKTVDLDGDDVEFFKLKYPALLDHLSEKLDKIAAQPELVGRYAPDPKYTAIVILKEFLPAPVIKDLAEKLEIALVRKKVIENLNLFDPEDVENKEPSAKKAKMEEKPKKKVIDTKGMKKMTSFFKVLKPKNKSEKK